MSYSAGVTDEKIRKTILELLAKRDYPKTICPSEVLPEPDRQDAEKMQAVRKVAQAMVRDGLIEITSKGEPVDLASHRGPIRLRTIKR